MQVVVGDVTVHICKWSICANGTMKTLPAQVTVIDTHHPCTRCKACQKICALTQAALIAAALCCADLVGGGGACSCMLMFPPAPMCMYACPALCTLTFSPCTCGGITDLCP